MFSRAQIPVSLPIPNPTPSYWHTPPSPLAQHIQHEADAPPSEAYDYTIIGSGLSGTLLAYNLLSTQPTARILLLEARALCSGATGRNGGHTKAASYRSYAAHARELGVSEARRIARMEYANIRAMHGLAAELGVQCESVVCETVDVVYDAGVFRAGVAAIEELKEGAEVEEKEEGGMAWYRVLEGKREVLEAGLCVSGENENLEVAEKEGVVGAFVYLAGRMHAYRFATGVMAECVKRGLVVATQTPVLDAVRGEDGLWEVQTEHSTILSRNVIVATNGYTAHLLPELQGVIVPLRGQVTAQRPGKKSRLTCPLERTYSFIYKDGYEYMIPRPLLSEGQHIIIGGGLGRLPNAGVSEYGTVDDGELNPQISKYLHGSLHGYFGRENWGEAENGEEKERVVQEWTGIMGATADGRPFVGEVPGKKGMWISAGFNGHGMVLCLKAAEALAEMIRNGGSVFRPEWFPESFMISQERLDKCQFRGRTDMQML